MTRTFGNQESCAACEPTCADRRLSLILLTGILMIIPFVSAYPLAAQTNGAASPQKQSSKQRFVCNAGYTQQECQAATAVLRKAQARYQVDALGEWTWILVRTEDWKQLLSERRFDPNHPAFSYLPKRETFLDGALVVKTSIRGVELSAMWHMPIEDLLDLAIRHELAHALCNDPDETKAERAALALKNGTPLSCQVTVQATTAFGQLPILRNMSNAATERPVKQRSNHKAEAAIGLRIYDFAGLEPVVLADAKKVTAEIFRKAGVETVWLNCPVDQADCTEEPERLQFMLRILSTAMKKDIVAENSLGFAVPCHEHDRGCLLYIFYSRISALAGETGIRPGRILGHVMAHELGHGLLGPDAHEGYGVMQAKLPISDLSWKTLYFTSAQSKRIRTELLARNQGLRSAAVTARFPFTLTAPEQ